MSAVPPDALEAAREYYIEHWEDEIAGRMNPLFARAFVTGLLEAATPHIAAAERTAERQRCAALLTARMPLDFLRRHGLKPGAGARQMLEAAAAEILAAGEGAPGGAT